MFGYIAPVLPALSEEQKRRYRSVYCGVCHALKTRHGQSGRLSLSNDMTFLALLLSSLYEPEDAPAEARCAVHPLKNHGYLSSPMIDFAADMNALLFFYKCVDQRMDDRSLRGKAGEALFRKASAKVRQLRPEQADAVAAALEELWAEEKAPEPNPDRLCTLSGRMLGSAFVPDPGDHWAPVLYTVGSSLGCFVYWMDAWEDLEDDLRKHRYNPLAAWRGRPDYEDFCRDTLEVLIAGAAKAFEFLPLEKDLDLMRNVIYSGVWQRYTLKTEKVKGKEEDHGQ